MKPNSKPHTNLPEMALFRTKSNFYLAFSPKSALSDSEIIFSKKVVIVMRKLVIGSGAALLAVGGVLVASAEPVSPAGAVVVEEKAAVASPVHKHKEYKAVNERGLKLDKLRDDSTAAPGGQLKAEPDTSKTSAPAMKLPLPAAAPAAKSTPKAAPQSSDTWK
jgi:hypothetical protein